MRTFVHELIYGTASMPHTAGRRPKLKPQEMNMDALGPGDRARLIHQQDQIAHQGKPNDPAARFPEGEAEDFGRLVMEMMLEARHLANLNNRPVTITFTIPPRGGGTVKGTVRE